MRLRLHLQAWINTNYKGIWKPQVQVLIFFLSRHMMPSTMPDISPSILGFPEFSAALGTLPSLKYSAMATMNDLKHMAFGSSRGQTSPVAGVFGGHVAQIV